MTCHLCGGQNTRTIPGPYHYTQCGLDGVFLHGVDHMECLECGESYVSIPNESRLLETIAKSILAADNPLGGQHIRFLRGLVGWTQDRLAAELGRSRVAVARWESESVAHPGKGLAHHLDLLLRLFWLRGFLEAKRVAGCGVLHDSDLEEMSQRIQHLSDTIARMRKAAPLCLTIDAETGRVVSTAC